MARLLALVVARSPSFWDTFWPTLAATFAGVAAGIPAGLFVNRLTERRSRNQRARADAALLDDLVAIVRSSLELNTGELGEVSRIINATGTSALAPAFDRSSWAANRGDVERLLGDVDLRSRLSRWFEELGRVERLIREHNDMSFGVRSTLTIGPSVRRALTESLQERCKQLVESAGSLDARLEKLEGSR